MNKQLATIRAIVSGNASIEFISKIPIKRVPRDVTDVAHN
jgi:hypothetical protein